jgi:cation:H+ antiporter
MGACAEDDVKQLYTKKMVDRVKKRPETGFEDPIAGSLDLIRENEPSTPLIFLQVAAALGLIIIGANMFVEQIEAIAVELGISTVILALIITPIATELPEKFNSFMWIRNSKDTFAIGNITGAMVFQSCIPVTIGILFTNWHLNLANTTEMLQAISIVIALFSGVVLYLESSHREIKKSGLFLGGVLYALFVALVLFSV